MDRMDNKMKILRVIATLLVVVGHSNFYLISTNIRGLGYNASTYVIDHSRFWTLSSYLVGLSNILVSYAAVFRYFWICICTLSKKREKNIKLLQR